MKPLSYLIPWFVIYAHGFIRSVSLEQFWNGPLHAPLPRTLRSIKYNVVNFQKFMDLLFTRLVWGRTNRNAKQEIRMYTTENEKKSTSLSSEYSSAREEYSPARENSRHRAYSSEGKWGIRRRVIKGEYVRQMRKTKEYGRENEENEENGIFL